MKGMKSLNGYSLVDATARSGVEENAKNIQTNAQAIQTNAEAAQTNADAIQTNAEAIQRNQENIQTNTQDIQINVENITKISEEISCGEPHKQFVTDGTGAVKWEDKEFYKSKKRLTLELNPEIDPLGDDGTYYGGGTASTDASQKNAAMVMANEIGWGYYEGRYTQFVFYYDGVRYEMAAKKPPYFFTTNNPFPFEGFIKQSGDNFDFAIQYPNDGKKHTLEFETNQVEIIPVPPEYLTGTELTTEDNGKVLGVEEGKFKLVEGGGSSSGKQITGQFTDEYYVDFDMSTADIMALGENLQDYRIVLRSSATWQSDVYTVTHVCHRLTEGNSNNTVAFTAVGSDHYIFVRLYAEDGRRASYTKQYRYFFQVPDPGSKSNAYLGTDEHGNYVLTPKAELEPAILYAMDTDGVLTFINIDTSEPYTITVEGLMSMLGYKGFVLTLGVVNTSGEGSAYTVSSFSQSGDMYILFENHEGKAIRMSADGTLSYVDKAKNSIQLADTVTNKTYKVTVADGKLTMEEVV